MNELEKPAWGVWVDYKIAPPGSYACLVSRFMDNRWTDPEPQWMPAQLRPQLHGEVRVMPYLMPSDPLAAVNALPELLAKVKRLEEALAFYADPANHIGYPDPNAKVYIETSAIDRDGGNRARALIAGVAIEDRFVQIGWTNEVQIGYVTTDGEGAFYPDSEHDCNVPVYRARAALNQETKP